MGQDCRARRRRRRRSPSGCRPLQVENAATSFALHDLAALELLRHHGAHLGAAGAAGVDVDACHGDVAALFRDAPELALEALRDLRLDLLPLRLEAPDLAAQVAER